MRSRKHTHGSVWGGRGDGGRLWGVTSVGSEVFEEEVCGCHCYGGVSGGVFSVNELPADGIGK